MIKLIGLHRALSLAGILVINLLILAVFFLIITPMHEETEGRLNSVNADISRLSHEIQNIKVELAAYEDNYALYQEMELRGFFMTQDRFQAGRLLDEMRVRSGLLGYAYKIEPIRALSNPDANKSNAELITSRITLDRVTSVIDLNVYTLMYNLATIFPEHTRIQSFSMKREQDITPAMLRSLSQEGGQALVTSKMVMDWLTVVPKEEDEQQKAVRGFRRR